MAEIKRIGVLAMQGAVAEHRQKIDALPGAESVLVKTKSDLESIDGIILPGGESTAMRKLLDYFGLLEPLKEKITQGLPVWGTCAGMILLAKRVENGGADKKTNEPGAIGAMSATVRRNAYGSQLDSFCASEAVPEIGGEKKLPLVFIRAPYIAEADETVHVLAKLDGQIIAAREKNMLATSFHPELTEDLSFHKYFLSMI